MVRLTIHTPVLLLIRNQLASLIVADRKSRQKSNRPLYAALIMEFISRNLRRTPSPSSALERAEYARRDKDMLWYLLRGSIWESYTRSVSLGSTLFLC